MFCHYCGAKLVKSARFCSKCGTPVPDEIQDEMKLEQGIPAPVTAPAAEPVLKAAPAEAPSAPVFTPAPVPEPQPAFTAPVAAPAMPAAPEPEPIKTVIEEPVKKEPETAPVFKTEEKEPVKEEHVIKAEPFAPVTSLSFAEPAIVRPIEPEKPAEPEKTEEPKEPEKIKEFEAEKKTEPVRSFETEKKPEPAVYRAPAPEKIVLPVAVTEKQIREQETVTLRSDALIEPLYLKLATSMKDGMRLKLTNAKLYPGENGAERVLVVALSVKEDEKPKLPLVEHVVDVRVTNAQIRAGETVALTDPELTNPLVLNLKPAMKDGMRLKFPNVELSPAQNGTKRLLIARIVVTDGMRTSYYNSPAVEKKPEPVRQTPQARPAQPAQKPAQTAQRPAQPVQRTSQPVRQSEPVRKTVSFAPASLACSFQLAESGSLKTGFHLGGADEAGTIEVAPSAISIYKKSKMVGAAFGVIGSMIEGKGRAFATVRPQDITSFEKNARGGRLFENFDYMIRLKDGRLLKLSFATRHPEKDLYAVDRFLSQV